MAEQAQATEQQPPEMAELTELANEARNMACLKPYEISDDLRPKIDELDLWDKVADLRDQGYAVVKDVAAPELFDRLREVIHSFAQKTEGSAKGLGASLLLGRHPTAEEAKNPETIPIEVEKGAVAVWDGAVWHGAGARTIPGTRTVLHATYQRLYTQPIDDYTYLLKDEAYVRNASKEMMGLLGADLFYGTATPTSGSTDLIKFMKSTILSKK